MAYKYEMVIQKRACHHLHAEQMYRQSSEDTIKPPQLPCPWTKLAIRQKTSNVPEGPSYLPNRNPWHSIASLIPGHCYIFIKGVESSKGDMPSALPSLDWGLYPAKLVIEGQHKNTTSSKKKGNGLMQLTWLKVSQDCTSWHCRSVPHRKWSLTGSQPMAWHPSVNLSTNQIKNALKIQNYGHSCGKIHPYSTIFPRFLKDWVAGVKVRILIFEACCKESTEWQIPNLINQQRPKCGGNKKTLACCETLAVVSVVPRLQYLTAGCEKHLE